MTDPFDDIRFESGRSDPARVWCLSVKQPLASLICEGGPGCVVKTTPPPVELMGKVLVIHAGQGDYTLRSFSPAAERAVIGHFGRPPKELRARLGPAGLVHGAVIGEARLVAAFVIGQVVEGCVHASVSARDRGGPYSGGRHMGIWSEFDGVPGVLGQPVAGRWLWAFERVRAYSEPEALKGFGGIFDLNKGRAIRAGQAQREADAAMSPQSGVPSRSGGQAS